MSETFDTKAILLAAALLMGGGAATGNVAEILFPAPVVEPEQLRDAVEDILNEREEAANAQKRIAALCQLDPQNEALNEGDCDD